MLKIDTDKLINVLTFDPENPIVFNSGFFVFFFLIVVLIYNLVKRDKQSRSLYLMLVSFYFYYKSSGMFLLVLLFTTVSDYLIGHEIHNAPNAKTRKRWLLLSLLVNIGMLCYFKYTNFFLGSVANILNIDYVPFNIFLPIGISFFTFQSMSYIIDIYYKKIEPLNDYVDYAFYVSFFPQLVAGPIVRAKDFIPQISKPTVVTNTMFSKGVFLIITGLFKKMVISDYISVNYVDRIFDAPTLYSGLENLIGVYGYALQIYCDFSGYSDMAIGLALLLGFHFNINFDSPYQSSSITEFWRRWHISLSGWLKDYIYIPLGGNRKGITWTYANLLITMLIGGLWHGASWAFIIWGGWHGMLLALDKLRMRYLAIDFSSKYIRNIQHYMGVFITFNLVCIGWVFFRGESLSVVGEVFSQINNGVNLSILPQFIDGYPKVVFLIILGYVLHALPRRYEQWSYEYFSTVPLVTKALIVAVFVFFLIQVRSSEILPFIYFQF